MKTVVLALDVEYHLNRLFVEGVSRFMRHYSHWDCFLMPTETILDKREEIAKSDGIIFASASKDLLYFIRKIGTPRVGVIPRQEADDEYAVVIDNKGVGTLAAQEFLSLGIQHLAFAGQPQNHFTHLRLAGFAEHAQGVRDERHCFFVGAPWESLLRRIGSWLESMPKPLGIFAAEDFVSKIILEAACSKGLHVPGDILVLGAGDNPIYCGLSPVPLSSIQLEGKEVGFQAASVLSELMEGRKPAQRQTMIPSWRIVRRQSTDFHAKADPLVSKAISIIEQRAHERIHIQDILSTLNVSRRTLERHFQEITGSTPAERLRQERIKKVKRLLRDTNWKMAKVAWHSGFRYTPVMSKIFKQIVGVAPSEYRKNHRSPAVRS